MKAIVVIGYHGLERPWGLRIWRRFQKLYPQLASTVHKYVVKCTSNDFESTGTVNEDVNTEVSNFIKENNFDLIIDLHCGIEDNPESLVGCDSWNSEMRFIWYRGNNNELRAFINTFSCPTYLDAWSDDEAFIGGRNNLSHVPYILLDFLMSTQDYIEINEAVEEGLHWETEVLKAILTYWENKQ